MFPVYRSVPPTPPNAPLPSPVLGLLRFPGRGSSMVPARRVRKVFPFLSFSAHRPEVNFLLSFLCVTFPFFSFNLPLHLPHLPPRKTFFLSRLSFMTFKREVTWSSGSFSFFSSGTNYPFLPVLSFFFVLLRVVLVKAVNFPPSKSVWTNLDDSLGTRVFFYL